MLPSYIFWEDTNHLAILDIYPSVIGQTLIITKRHYPSYVFEMPERDYLLFMEAARRVSRILDTKLKALRTCLVMEGMEVNHSHLKLYPIYKVLAQTSTQTADLNEYPGYLTTLHGLRATDENLRRILNVLTN